jgi:hypothetical protein
MLRKEESINTKSHVLGRDERSTAIRRTTNFETNYLNQKRGTVITNKHLAIVRAALTFWDEEMASIEESVYKHYLHSVDLGTRITATDVVAVRKHFNEVELKFALVENESGRFVSENPVDTVLSYQPDKEHLVCVLARRIDPASFR